MKKTLETKKAPAAMKKANVPAKARPNALPMLTPFNAMRRFTDEWERLFDDLSNFNFNLNPFFAPTLAFPTFTEFETPFWSPKIEVLEKKEKMVVRAELPGLTKEDINVEFVDNALLISGERNVENEEEQDGFYHTEREYGSFFRTIPLPQGADVEHATATFNDGVLEIALNVPTHKTKGKKLEIAAKTEPMKAKTAGAR